MNKQQLKNSILQWAIQGKLVPQIASEGTAEDLLKEIRAEKEKLVKEGKLKKKDLEVKPIEDDEIPFDVPEGWRWVRLGEILDVRDGTHDSPKYVSDGYPLVTSKNLSGGQIDFTTALLINEEDYNKIKTRSCVDNDDILYAMIGSIGNPVLVKKERDFAIKNMALFKKINNGANMIFIYYFLQLEQYAMREFASGGVQSFVSLGYLRNYIIPLPPLSEQKRIVSKIEELMPLVEEYGKAQEQLETLNKELPEKLKKSVLQEAIMGKLVPQDPKEGTADELLAEIRKEKERLVKEGKLKKKDLEVKPIAEDDVPFEVPDSWRWVRLGEISTYALSKKKINASMADSNLWGLDLENIEKGGRLLCRKLVGERGAIGDKTFFSKGDILYSKLRPYLLKILVAPENGICTPEIVPFSCYGSVDVSYVVYLLKSSYVDEYINSTTFGIKMPRVSSETMVSLLVPLPPLEEQRRIVEKIEEVMKMIDK